MKPVPPHKSLLSLVALLVALGATSTLAQSPADDFQMISTGSGLTLHKEMFMLPLTLSTEYHDSQTEAVFQLSAKHRLFNTRFYFAYTQISFWQAYDHHHSAPFRETNYNPELFYRTKRHPFGSGFVGLDVGFEHESNGQIPPLSRSWNLLYVGPNYSRDNMLVYLKLRYRIPESEKESPGAAVGDDNPDITDYLGYLDFHVYYKFWSDQSVHLMVRGSVSEGRGGMYLIYSLPVPGNSRSRICVRFSHGCGESMVDYNRSLSRLGVGIMF
jgi:phospholipase A1